MCWRYNGLAIRIACRSNALIDPGMRGVENPALIAVGISENISGTFAIPIRSFAVTDADTKTSSRANEPLAGINALRAAELPVVLAASPDHWSPELRLPRSVWEIFSSNDEASGEAMALAFAQQQCRDRERTDHWLWVQDAASIRRCGRPYFHGLPMACRSGMLHVEARNAADALWAMEEGVRCGALSFVIGELANDPRSLDFTATRRLVLASERHGVPLYLLRRDGHADLSAARLRWRAEAAPSALHPWNATAPGAPRVSAELFRGRGLKPGRFLLDHGFDRGNGSHEPGNRLALVPELCDRPLEPQRRLKG